VIKKMKSIFLSVVVISALAIAGIGGTMANFSDTEMVTDNYFSTGDFDIKVYDPISGTYTDDVGYGVGASDVMKVDWACPEKVYSANFWVKNDGSCDGELKFKIKQIDCENITPSHGGIYCDAMDDYRTEPELVEEFGGQLDQECVPARGIQGDGCTMRSRVWVMVKVNDVVAKIDGNKWNLTMDIDETWYVIGDLPACGAPQKVTLFMKFLDEEDPNWKGDPQFKYHWTNAVQADKMTFDVEFGGVTVDP
jgi:predicted ribosomally synthesized peptide with SipW-like signal peptide